MKKYLHFSRFLVLLVGLLTISANSAWGGTLTKLGSDASFAAGDQIVVVATGTEWAKLMYQETVSTSYVAYKTIGTETGNVALTADGIGADTKNYFTLSAGTTSGTWKLGDATNGYIYNASSNNLTCVTDNSTDWTISWDKNQSKFSIKTGSRWLSCRNDLTGDNQYKFRGGGTTSTSGTVYFDIYKYEGSSGGVTYTEVWFQQAGTPAHPGGHCVVIPFVQNCPQARRLRHQYSFQQAGTLEYIGRFPLWCGLETAPPLFPAPCLPSPKGGGQGAHPSIGVALHIVLLFIVCQRSFALRAPLLRFLYLNANLK